MNPYGPYYMTHMIADIGEIGYNISTYRYEFSRVVSSGPFDEIVSRMTDIDGAIPQYVSIDES